MAWNLPYMYRRFVGIYCCHHQENELSTLIYTEYGGNTFIWNVVHIYQTARHHIPDDSRFHSYCREDLNNDVIFEDTARFWAYIMVQTVRL